MSNILSISVRKMDHGSDLPLPSFHSSESSGVGLLASISDTMKLQPGKRALIPTGIAMALPEGYEAQIRPRPGLALKNGITVLNGPYTVNSDDRKEISVILINQSEEDFLVKRGMPIALLVVSPITKFIWSEADQIHS